MLGAAAGILFGVSDIAIKAISGLIGSDGISGLLTPWTLFCLVASVAAFYASAKSLQEGEAVPVIAVTGTAANVAGIVGGIIVFRDRSRGTRCCWPSSASPSCSSSRRPGSCQRQYVPHRRPCSTTAVPLEPGRRPGGRSQMRTATMSAPSSSRSTRRKPVGGSCSCRIGPGELLRPSRLLRSRAWRAAAGESLVANTVTRREAAE